VSKRRFYRRRYGLPGQILYDLMTSITASRDGQGHLFTDIEDLGQTHSAPVVDVPGAGPYLAEISADPGFVFAAGRLDVQRRFAVPADVWDGLAPATYYLRFLHRGTWRIERTVKLTKVSAPASRPVEPVAVAVSQA
jgi:hypothetical protein